jgi:hypothetical protein
MLAQSFKIQKLVLMLKHENVVTRKARILNMQNHNNRMIEA